MGRGRRGQSGGNTTGRNTEKSSEKRREGVLRAEHALFRGNSMPKPEKTKPPRPSQAPAEADGARLPVRRAGRTMSTAAPDRGKTEKNGGESSFPREGKGNRGRPERNPRAVSEGGSLPPLMKSAAAQSPHHATMEGDRRRRTFSRARARMRETPPVLPVDGKPARALHAEKRHAARPCG